MKSCIQAVKQTALSVLLHKSINERAIEWIERTVSPADTVYFCLSSNPIIALFDGKGCTFFRECITLDSPKLHLQRRIDLFFDLINQNDLERMGFTQRVPIEIRFDSETVTTFKAYLNGIRYTPRFVRKMQTIDRRLDRMNYSIWSASPLLDLETLHSLGLVRLDKAHTEIALYFIWQMRSAAYIRRTAQRVRGSERSYFGAVRAIASNIVADSIGLASMITDTVFCRLQIGDRLLYGTLSRAAEGVRACDAEITPTPSLQRALTALTALDLICFQTDHGVNNYNIALGKGICSISAFDNDNPNTFFPIGRVDRSLVDCTPLISKSGIVNRDHFERRLAERLLLLDEQALCRRLKPYLNALQCHALKRRIRKFRAALRKTIAQKPNFLFSDAQWSEAYLKAECEGRFGKTYLTVLLDRTSCR